MLHFGGNELIYICSNEWVGTTFEMTSAGKTRRASTSSSITDIRAMNDFSLPTESRPVDLIMINYRYDLQATATGAPLSDSPIAAFTKKRHLPEPKHERLDGLKPHRGFLHHRHPSEFSTTLSKSQQLVLYLTELRWIVGTTRVTRRLLNHWRPDRFWHIRVRLIDMYRSIPASTVYISAAAGGTENIHNPYRVI